MTVTSLSIQAPITALCSIAASASNSAFLLAGSADQLVASALDSSSPSTSSKRWKVFKRERVHRIISEVVGDSWRVLVSGGKEAALLQLRGR